MLRWSVGVRRNNAAKDIKLEIAAATKEDVKITSLPLWSMGVRRNIAAKDIKLEIAAATKEDFKITSLLLWSMGVRRNIVANDIKLETATAMKEDFKIPSPLLGSVGVRRNKNENRDIKLEIANEAIYLVEKFKVFEPGNLKLGSRLYLGIGYNGRLPQLGIERFEKFEINTEGHCCLVACGQGYQARDSCCHGR